VYLVPAGILSDENEIAETVKIVSQKSYDAIGFGGMLLVCDKTIW
jgi:hypothetical protein